MILSDEIEFYRKRLESSERMKEALEKRLHLLGFNKANKSEFERNEDDILRLETENRLERLSVVIPERRAEFEEAYSNHIEYIETNKL